MLTMALLMDFVRKLMPAVPSTDAKYLKHLLITMILVGATMHRLINIQFQGATGMSAGGAGVGMEMTMLGVLLSISHGCAPMEEPLALQQ